MNAFKKVGILGGTFNPIHKGHLTLAQCALDEYELDEVLFIPTGISYFKEQTAIVDKERRAKMCRLAIEDNPRFTFSAIEIDRQGNSYTYETLEELKKDNPNVQYYLIIGADSLFSIEQWKNPDIIMKDASILVAVREGQSREDLSKKAEELHLKYDAEIMLLSMPYMDISSTEIRKKIKMGESVEHLLKDSTFKYIEEFGLYRD